MVEEQKNRSFWQTLPGVLTAIAAVITAVTGLVVALRSWDTRPANVAPPIEGSEPAKKPGTPRPEPALLWTSTCVESDKIKWWDLDNPKCSSSLVATSGSDFWFKHTNFDPAAEFCVDAKNGAKFAPLQADRLPWEIPSEAFIANSCAVPQRKMIPCLTSQSQPCQFKIQLDPTGKYSWRLIFARYQHQ